MNPEKLAELAERAVGLHEKLANCHPLLRRGQVWCRTCGHTDFVDSADYLRNGWPKCCGYTMTIDAPDRSLSGKRSSTDGEGAR